MLLCGVAFAVLLAGCGGVIPSPYRGIYVDGPSGTRLELQKEAGILTFADGYVAQASAQDLSFAELLNLKPGIYVFQDPKKHKTMMEVYWISPKAETKSEQAGLLSVNAEVAFTTMRSDVEEEVQQLPLTHCFKGRVMLDLVKQRWQAGCAPGEATYFDMKRERDNQ